MDIKDTITDKDGNQKSVKVQMPSIGRIMEAVKQRGLFGRHYPLPILAI